MAELSNSELVLAIACLIGAVAIGAIVSHAMRG